MCKTFLQLRDHSILSQILCLTLKFQITFQNIFFWNRISDEYDSFVASFVCSLLTDGPSAPMYKSLVESGLGSSYSPMTGLLVFDWFRKYFYKFYLMCKIFTKYVYLINLDFRGVLILKDDFFKHMF